MRDLKQVAADIDIFVCDLHAPWQRDTTENAVVLFPTATWVYRSGVRSSVQSC